jgi:hypothetical protein
MLAALRTREMKKFAFVLGVIVLLLVIGLVVLVAMDKLPSAESVVTAGVVFVVMLFFFGLGSIREKPRARR